MSYVATTLTIHQRAVRSSVVKKVIMSVTGLLLIGFLLMHMYGNLKVFLGPEAFNHYAEWLKGDILYPIVPKGTFIWVFRILLLVAVVLHIWSAAVLSARTIKVRGDGYQVKKLQEATYASRTMRWGGVIILGFIIFHILQFTVKSVRTGFEYESTPYEMVVLSFQQWWVVLLYAVLMLVVVVHIRHGFMSAFTTLGGNVSAKAHNILSALGVLVAVVLYIGFMVMPFGVLFGVGS
ncbi:MAG: succinate dehydrogenase [Arachnia propionica]|nr:MAG: succinate dehydrogenase [Arachnia propionica]